MNVNFKRCVFFYAANIFEFEEFLFIDLCNIWWIVFLMKKKFRF